MEDKTLVVPVDAEGVFDYENDVTKIDKLKYFRFPYDEFEIMYSDGFFDLLNDKFDLWIGEYEEEIIPYKYLTSIKEMLQKSKKKYPKFLEALDFAIECDTELCLEL